MMMTQRQPANPTHHQLQQNELIKEIGAASQRVDAAEVFVPLAHFLHRDPRVPCVHFFQDGLKTPMINFSLFYLCTRDVLFIKFCYQVVFG
jgi:hypothetical protein